MGLWLMSSVHTRAPLTKPTEKFTPPGTMLYLAAHLILDFSRREKSWESSSGHDEAMDLLLELTVYLEVTLEARAPWSMETAQKAVPCIKNNLEKFILLP